MNEAEYKQWIIDAQKCLSCKYSEDEIRQIITWFNYIKGSNERDLIGDVRLEAFSVFSCAEPMDNCWNLYDSLMARLWIYAPYILKEGDFK